MRSFAPLRMTVLPLLLLISLLLTPPVFAVDTAPNTELEGIFRKIESRHYRWIAIRSDVLLFFAKAGDSNAMCGGELLYQRLDERMFLTCVDARQELMFAFRTLDRRFDLYLPAQNTVYHGSIFDLEDSPDIESHLKARDLYRALKPMAMDPRRTKVDRTNSAMTSLDVYGQGGNGDKLARKLYLTPEGDVRGELFYNAAEKPVTEIQRYDFREIRGRSGSFDSIIFPKKITIMSPETQKGSAIFFTEVTALDTIDPLEFILRVPPGTKEVFLDEKDPRYQHSKTSESEARPGPKVARYQRPKAATAAPDAAPNLSIKAVPVYLAKPREVSATKMKPAPALKKEETPEAPKPPSTPSWPTSATTDTSAKADATIPESPQVSIVQPPATDNQTTLDPSVEPSAEMGKQ